ncbi:UDP-N-acetyl-D-glucosamine 6-dehydrogenase [compost metagenome]
MNDSKPQWVIDKVKLAVAEFLQTNRDKTAREVTIACFGLAFKADIDDLRESPAIEIIQRIIAAHPGPVLAVEPNIVELPSSLSEKTSLTSIQSAINEADVLVLLVDHKEFKDMSKTADKAHVDTRGLWQ